MKKTLLALAILAITLILGAGAVWGYLYYSAHGYARNFTCAQFNTGIANLSQPNSLSETEGDIAAIHASTAVLGFANIRARATNPAGSMSMAPVPFTAYNQLASLCKAQPGFKVLSFVNTNDTLSQTDPSAANDALDTALAGVKIEEYPAGEVYARILSAFRPTENPNGEAR